MFPGWRFEDPPRPHRMSLECGLSTSTPIVGDVVGASPAVVASLPEEGTADEVAGGSADAEVVRSPTGDDDAVGPCRSTRGDTTAGCFRKAYSWAHPPETHELTDGCQQAVKGETIPFTNVLTLSELRAPVAEEAIRGGG
jgi:hypothetical protein